MKIRAKWLGPSRGLRHATTASALVLVVTVSVPGGEILPCQSAWANQPLIASLVDHFGPLTDQGGRTDAFGDALPEGALARLGTVCFRHGPVTNVVAFSPDGKLLASGADAAGLGLWDAATGRPLYRLPELRDVRSLAFFPDGRRLVVSRTLAVIDVATGKELRRFQGARVPDAVVACAPAGDLVAATDRNEVVFWNATTGAELRRLTGHAADVQSLAFSPDGKTLASGAEDRTVRLWEVATGRELARLEGHAQPVLVVAFSPDGRLVASAGRDRVIRLWDVASGKERHRLAGHDDWVRAAAFSPDGRTLASGGLDGTIRVWDVATAKERRRWQGSAVSVTSVAFAPDGRTLASAGAWDHAIRLWDTTSGRAIHPVVAHTGEVRALHFTADGKTLVSHGWDGRVLFWDPVNGAQPRQVLDGPRHRSWPATSALSPDDTVLAQADLPLHGEEPDPTIRLWETAKGDELRRLQGHADQVLAVAFAPNSRTLASGSRHGTLCLHDVPSGRLLHRCKAGPDAIWVLAFSPAGGELVTGEPGGTIRLWEVATGKELRHWKGPNESVRSVIFSPDGRWLASADFYHVRVWEVATGKQLRLLEGRGLSLALALSPSGRLLAGVFVASELRAVPVTSIAVWEVATGQEVARFPGQLPWTWSLAFSPDGRTLASGGSDSTILIWDLTGRQSAGRSRSAAPTAAELVRCWDDLGAEAPKANRAVWILADVPAEAVRLLGERLRPIRPADPERLQRLVAALDNDRFEMRRQATQELAALGELAASALRRALADRPALETRRRLEQLLEKLEGPVTEAEVLRPLRAVEVLELIGTPAAQAVLTRLAQGAPGARQTEQAKASLERLAKRPGPDRARAP